MFLWALCAPFTKVLGLDFFFSLAAAFFLSLSSFLAASMAEERKALFSVAWRVICEDGSVGVLSRFADRLLHDALARPVLTFLRMSSMEAPTTARCTLVTLRERFLRTVSVRLFLLARRQA